MPRYIGRLAPSPTGLLHVGHARTFHIAWQRAQAANGILLLRIEDLDRDRSRPHFVDALLEDLAWLGIAWDPPMLTQTQRLPLYRKALERLIASGDAYPCTCSRRDLRRAIAAPHEDLQAPLDDEPVYPGTCRLGTCPPGTGPPSHLAAPEPFRPNVNYRFRVPDGEPVRFVDGNAGPQQFRAGSDPHTADYGDFLLWRRDGFPSYQLACVVDDAATGTTEVVRGRDLLKSTARQILVARALTLPSPAWFHTDLIRDSSGARLAKRHDALAIRTLRQQGLTPAEVLRLPG